VYFLGTYEYSMDERGRVPLPPRYRDSFLHGMVLSEGSPDPCLRVYTQETYDAQAALYTSEPPIRRRGRLIRRGFFSRSFPAELDRQGRVLVPPPLRRYAGLEGNVVLTGEGEWLEIWNPERLKAAMKDVDEHYEETLESVEPPP